MSESLLFEKSVPGRRAMRMAALDVPSRNIAGEVPQELLRQKAPALAEVSEFDVVRHFTRLSQLNFSADTHFYPLGSCTMKYNPKVNEWAAALSGFADLHPYQSAQDCQGVLELLWHLEHQLCALTGMGAFSLHPAAGAQGEFLGLLVARNYFKSRGEERTEVLVPDSAHGTNPASAALAGFAVRTVPSDASGRVDPQTLKKYLSAKTAMVMITCPNTLGLFENQIQEIARIVHEQGALLYMDGANFNALVGLVEPAKLGFDVMHINLHKTFSVPHGGGGPGAGPVGVAEFLKEFLPQPRIHKEGETFHLFAHSEKSIGQLRAFIGSTGALIRAYAYILALGDDGLRGVGENAILNANYLRVKLKKLLPLYIDEPCMHECVFTGSQIAKETGIKTLDLVKRLLDYGFYAPTIYFPLIVPEAMMVEPTETESLQTLDAFIATMEKIVEESRTNPEAIKAAPQKTPVRRLDEVLAARNPILRWRAHSKNSQQQ